MRKKMQLMEKFNETGKQILNLVKNSKFLRKVPLEIHIDTVWVQNLVNLEYIGIRGQRLEELRQDGQTRKLFSKLLDESLRITNLDISIDIKDHEYSDIIMESLKEAIISGNYTTKKKRSCFLFRRSAI